MWALYTFGIDASTIPAQRGTQTYLAQAPQYGGLQTNNRRSSYAYYNTSGALVINEALATTRSLPRGVRE